MQRAHKKLNRRCIPDCIATRLDVQGADCTYSKVPVVSVQVFEIGDERVTTKVGRGPVLT